MARRYGRAMTQNNLGTALEILGERESERARLEEAVDRLGGEIAKPPPEIVFSSALVDREVLGTLGLYRAISMAWRIAASVR